ncbi:MAG: ubiquitin-like domain-containing protein [Sciscionella sp.]
MSSSSRTTSVPKARADSGAPRHRATGENTAFAASTLIRRGESAAVSTGRHYGTGTLLQDRPVAVGAPYSVSTQDVLDVLGPDAEDLLKSSELEISELVTLLNAETMLLPRIDAEMEAEIEAALAGATEDEQPVRAPGSPTNPWRKRFLRAAIGAVLLAAAGGVSAAAMDKSVTMDVDGHTSTVHTFSGTVGEVLAKQDITVGPHDSLSPSPSASIGDGGTIVLDRGRRLAITVDGVTQHAWTRAGTVGTALRQLKVHTADAWMSEPGSAQIPLGGGAVQIKTMKSIAMIDGSHAPRSVDTHAVTVRELLTSLNMHVGPKDSVNPGENTKVTSGMQVMISRTGVTVVNKNEPIAPPVTQEKDSSMLQGQQQVLNPGVPGQKVVTYRITKVNGSETKRETLGTKIVKKPEAKVVKVGTKTPPQPAISNGALWDRIAQCESSGNWSTDTGNGYYGGLQFDHSTWMANGGGQYASNANQATKAQQIAVANRVKARRGLSPWECARNMGLA